MNHVYHNDVLGSEGDPASRNAQKKILEFSRIQVGRKILWTSSYELFLGHLHCWPSKALGQVSTSCCFADHMLAEPVKEQVSGLNSELLHKNFLCLFIFFFLFADNLVLECRHNYRKPSVGVRHLSHISFLLKKHGIWTV